MQTKAKEVHYSQRFKGEQFPNEPICHTRHGKQVSLTTEPLLVTCRICKFHIGLHRPVKGTTAKPIHPEVGQQLELWDGRDDPARSQWEEYR